MQKRALTIYSRCSVTTASFLVTSILAASCALAAGTDAANASPSASDQLQVVTITSPYEFLSADTSGTTNLPLPIEQVPQSISLMSNDFVEAADLKNIGDIADYVPGLFNNGPNRLLKSVS